MRGHIIALYGVNNLGKTTQAKRLAERLSREGIQARYQKYPLYDLSPSGPLLNAYVREGNPHNLSAREFQILQVLNRTQYDAEVRSMREAGWTLVFEDYIGTGIAWGVKTGVSRDLLLELNQHLAAVDIPILLDGQRFLESREENHIFETNDALTDQARSIHLDLAKEFSWPIVAANQPLETVEAQIWDIVHKRIFAK